ncbi:MAG: hypothetical protein LBQ10_06115 [Desulfovibrio sp.]|nr:hypothetical protein [Desulfovibrio sp.]
MNASLAGLRQMDGDEKNTPFVRSLALSNSAQICFVAGELQEARADAEKAVSLYANIVGGYRTLSYVDGAEHKFAVARANMEKTLENLRKLDKIDEATEKEIEDAQIHLAAFPLTTGRGHMGHRADL